jgi:hypothetical protein
MRQLNVQLDDQRKTISELLNRLQADDLHAFATLQANTSQTPPRWDDETYIPKSDEGEAAQLKALYDKYGQTQGLGETLFLDNEDREYMEIIKELGI